MASSMITARVRRGRVRRRLKLTLNPRAMAAARSRSGGAAESRKYSV
jgi:hypothetical protein